MEISVEDEKKNIDRRTCYKFNRNYFLVKPPFTTGHRTVKSGTKHLIQLDKCGMRLYLVDYAYREKVKETHRGFNGQDLKYYTLRFLEATKKYYIPEGTRYLLYTTQNTFFAVHKVHDTVQLPEDFLNAITEAGIPKPVVDTLYMRPPHTPQIETVVLGDDYDEEEEEEEEEEVNGASQEPACAVEMVTPDIEFPQIIYTIPLKKEIVTVTPNVVNWFQSMQFKQFNDPKEHYPVGPSEQEEPVNLIIGATAVSSPMATSSSVADIIFIAASTSGISTDPGAQEYDAHLGTQEYNYHPVASTSTQDTSTQDTSKQEYEETLNNFFNDGYYEKYTSNTEEDDIEMENIF